MTEPNFLTITIDDKCFDLPKNMQIPLKGSTIFINGKTGIVENIHYHIVDGELYMISIFTI